MRDNLLAWQWSHYPTGHRSRANLLLHAATNPLFLAGTVALPLSLLAGWPLLPAGLLAMVTTMAAQGRGHKGETSRPIPFEGAGDLLSRFFVEQWVNFPRFVLSGGFGRAWREAGAPVTASSESR